MRVQFPGGVSGIGEGCISFHSSEQRSLATREMKKPLGDYASHFARESRSRLQSSPLHDLDPPGCANALRAGEPGGAARKYCFGQLAVSPSALAAWTAQ